MIREVDHEVCITVNHVSTQTVNHVPLDKMFFHMHAICAENQPKYLYFYTMRVMYKSLTYDKARSMI